MTKKKAKALIPGDAVYLKRGSKRILCVVTSQPKEYSNMSGFVSVLVAVKTPSGNYLEHHNRDLDSVV